MPLHVRFGGNSRHVSRVMNYLNCYSCNQSLKPKTILIFQFILLTGSDVCLSSFEEIMRSRCNITGLSFITINMIIVTELPCYSSDTKYQVVLKEKNGSKVTDYDFDPDYGYDPALYHVI